MEKLLNSTTVLIIGVIIFVLGGYQNNLYEQAKANGYEVEAEIVEVIVEREVDEILDYTYAVYADYTVDGKKYTHIRIGEYTSPKYVGKKITVVVNPENPDKMMAEGGIFLTFGFVAAIGAAISKIIVKNKKEGAK